MNALTGFRLNANELAKQVITESVRETVGKSAIEVVRSRIQSAKDVNDAPAKPYSPRGPIYIPIVRGGMGTWNSAEPNRGRLRGVGSHYAHGTSMSRRFANKRGGDYRRTMKFPDWAAFKRYIGHSGSRDLEVTGKMLGSITITENAADHVCIGYEDAEQEAKARGNNDRSEQWGFSPADQEKIFSIYEQLLLRAPEPRF